MVCKLLIVREANYCPHCKSPQDETLFPFSINAECAAANLEMQRVRDTCAAYSGKSMHIGGSALTHSSERTVQVLLSVSKAKKLSSERLYLRAVDALVGRLGLGDPWTKNRSKTERTDCANHIRLVQETYEGKQAANVAAIRSSNLELLVSRGFNVDHIDKSIQSPATTCTNCSSGMKCTRIFAPVSSTHSAGSCSTGLDALVVGSAATPCLTTLWLLLAVF